jgi:membrane fusion protein, multidrug efflux system
MDQSNQSTEQAPKPPRRSRRLSWGIGLVAVVAVAGTAAAKLAPHDSPPAGAAAPMPAVPVSVAVVARRDTTVWDDFSGQIEAVGHVEVRPRVAGAVIAAHFREGSIVKQGDLLFTIDPAPYQAEVERSEAQVATAAARLMLAAREQQRAMALVGSGATPQRDVDQRINEFHAAEANLSDAQAALDLSRLDLGWTQVRAPITGRVGRIMVTAGNLVSAGAGAPVLTTVVSVNPIYASFDADERSVGRALATLPPGKDFNSEIGLIPVQLGTLATDGTPIQGKLEFVDNTVDQGSGTVRLRAVFDNPDGQLMPGQFARLRLGGATSTPTIAIDERAIGTDQDRRFVMVVGPDDKVSYRAIQLGAMADGLRVVTAGLRPGDRIVVDGLQRIGPGSIVAPQAVAMSPPAGVAVASD